jgi:hypothetical protein
LVEVSVRVVLTPNRKAEVTCRHLASQSVARAQIHIFEVGEIETAWRMSTGSIQISRPEAGAIVAEVDLEDLPKGIYEIRRIELSEDGAISTVLVAGRDFSRTFFEIGESQEQPRDTAEIARAAYEIEARRQVLFSRPLGDLSIPDAKEYRLLCFVERCLIRRGFQFPGFQLMPLDVGSVGEDFVGFLNQFLATNGWGTRIQVDQWVAQAQQGRPMVVFHFPRVFARNEHDAGSLVHEHRDRILDLLAIHRGTSAGPVATVIERLVDPGKDSYGEGKWLLEAEPYTGNLLGGFISGENPVSLLAHFRAIQTEPLAALWVSLFRDARGEFDVHFGFFRYWNVLETMASTLVQRGQPVKGARGDPLMIGSTAATTGMVVGRVHWLLRETLQRDGLEEEAFTSADSSQSLWEEVQVWYAFRNAAAHHGRFQPGDAAQMKQSWYQRALEAFERVEASGRFDDVLANPYLRDLREAAERTLYSELDRMAARLGPLT